jgi:hypothetical protein
MTHEDERLGRVTLSPQGPVVAGSVGEWTLTYVVGSYGIDEGGTIKIARRFASDWQRPQFDDPKAEGYTTVSTNGEARLKASFDPKGYVRPWMRCIVIDVYDGSLAPGDVVTIKLGDRSGGSPGIRSQSFVEARHEMLFLVDPTNACLVRRLPSSPVFAIVAGEPASVVVIVPTQAIVGEPVEVFVKGEDQWGNPTPAPADVQLRWDGDDGAVLVGRSLMFHEAARGCVIASWGGSSASSNPIVGLVDAPQFGKYWGDLHAQSDATVGTGTEREYFAFGRDWARLDVMSHQGNDFQMDDEDWTRLQDAVREVHEDGRFVVFPGFEWSANTPAGGDRNVIYLEEDLPMMRSSHWQIPAVPETAISPAHPADDLFAKLRANVDLSKVLVAAHCGGRYADIRRYFDEELGPLVEVLSCWGEFEWLLWDAFEKGYRVGVVCNSDGHKGRPGAEGPGAGQFGIWGGLTCVLAESLTRGSVFSALKQRRCYGTSGPRIDLDFTVDGQPMGSCFEAGSSVHVRASVHGAGPVEALELRRGREPLLVVRPPAFDDCGSSRRVRVAWGGARIRGRGRRAEWDGSIEVEGARIERAETFAFDAPTEGIVEFSPMAVRFRSRTTGDTDGIDVWLDRSDRGRVVFRSPVGTVHADVATLGVEGVVQSFGGVYLRARIARYPEIPQDRMLELQHTVELDEGTTPLFVKAVQVDGHLAWSSPVYPTRSAR